jgi:sugar phosphate isomerase/epimerase
MELCLRAGPQANVPLAASIRPAARAGFTCLNLWAPALDATLARYPIAWLDEQLQTHGLYAGVVSGLEPLDLRSRPDFAILQSHLVDLCVRLDALGGSLVVICAPSPTASEQALSIALQGLSDLVAPFDVRIAVELGHKNDAVDGLARAQQIISRTGRPNVGMAVDLAHLESATNTDLQNLDMDKLWLVDLGTPGAPGGAIEKRCHHLLDMGFRGPYSIELAFQKGDPGETIHAARQAALEMLSQRCEP